MLPPARTPRRSLGWRIVFRQLTFAFVPPGQKWVFGGLAGLCVLLTSARAESHQFTDVDGKSFTADVLMVNAGEVDLKREDGKVYRVEISTLSPDDRGFLHAWKSQPPKAKNLVATTSSDIDIVVKVQPLAGTAKIPLLMQPKITLSNGEPGVNYPGLKGTFIILMQEISAPHLYRVVAKEAYAITLPALGEQEITGPSFTEIENDAEGVPRRRFKAWIFVLQSSDGNIIQFHSSESIVKSGTMVLSLKAGAYYDANFRLIGGTYPQPASKQPGIRSSPVNPQVQVKN